MASKTKRKSAGAPTPPASPQPPVPAQPPIPAQPLAAGFGRDLANTLFPAFLVMILIGFFLIWKLGSAAGNPNPVRALFIAMNSATLSGFSVNPGVGGLNPFGQWVSLVLIIGGSLFAMIVGGLAVIRITAMPITDRAIIVGAIVFEALALALAAPLLWDVDRSPFQALYLAASAFGNCGQVIGNLPGPATLPVHAIILPLAVLGGLGIPSLIELWRAAIALKPVSHHTRVVLGMSAWLYAGGFILIFALNQAGRGPLTISTIREQLPAASVVAVEARTGGMSIARAADLTRPAQWIVAALMAIGASPAGTGSGLKTTTVVALIAGGKKLLAGQYPGRPFAIAFVWLATYAGLALGAVLLLSYVASTDPGDSLFFHGISALSNVGLTVSSIPDEKGMFFAYCAIELVGRMAPLLVLWWMAETATEPAELAVG